MPNSQFRRNVVGEAALAVDRPVNWSVESKMKLKYAFRKFKKRCPQCADGRLDSRNLIRATRGNDNGEHYPNSWSYYECDSCNCKLKIFINGKIETPTDGEWLSHRKKHANFRRSARVVNDKRYCVKFFSYNFLQ
jgi:hypothetical protein